MTINLIDLPETFSSEAQIEFLMIQKGLTYDQFILIIDHKIKKVRITIEEMKNKFVDLDEDLITLYFLAYFKGVGFLAAFEENSGGHCDLIIHHNELTWKAEAKIFGGKNEYLYWWLKEGLEKQLLNNYLISEDLNSGFLIYCKSRKSLSILRKWMKKIRKLEGFISISIDETNRTLDHCHEHPGSGTAINIKHYIFSLAHSDD